MTQKVYVVGLGPGGIEQMTQRAKAALESCDVIAGYHVYIDLIKNDFTGKEFLTTGMRKEVDRCKLAIEEALKGKTVAMISSGDAGVYGMAGIMYQVAAEHPELEIEVVPGITAACSGAAVLGAPLISDFCLISLSDLLTPWEKIVRNIGRDGENYEITTLQELRDKEVDMFSTVIIGNSQTEVINGKLVTPRGYKL